MAAKKFTADNVIHGPFAGQYSDNFDGHREMGSDSNLIAMSKSVNRV